MMQYLRWLFLTTVYFASLSSVQATTGKKTICVRQQSSDDVTIVGGMRAGNFMNLGRATDINDCLNMACGSNKGNIAFFLSTTCYAIQCYDIKINCKLTPDNRGRKAAGARYSIIEAYPVFKNATGIVFIPEDTDFRKEITHLEVAAESRETKKEMMSFKIETGNVDETFRLYPKSSNSRVALRLQKYVYVDREIISSYQLTITASNVVENVTTSFNITIFVTDINDNPPVFVNPLFVFNVFSNMSVVTTIGKGNVNSPVLRINATDADEGDNGRIRFVIVSGNINNTFVLQSDGMIFLRKSLKQTRVSTFNITVAAWDHGTPPLRSTSTAVVSIHVQGDGTRNAPWFVRDSYSVEISENVSINTMITQVKARVYQGSSRVTYWMRNRVQKYAFYVEPNTGRIRTTERLDREERNVYVLTIMASTDVLHRVYLSAMVNITITLKDENDNRPIFAHDYYSERILSSPKVGTRIAIIKAIDKDVGPNARIHYKIKRGHNEKYFTINSRTGLITTKRLLPIESLTVLKCFISARDEGIQSLSSLNDIPLYVIMGSTFSFTVQQLERTTSDMRLLFTMVNVSLEHVNHIGVVVQEVDSINDYDKITKRPFRSWHYIHNKIGNGAYAQRYLSGKVLCNELLQKTKIFQFNVGADGSKCQKNKTMFCNGKLQADKKYRFQLVAYFKNDAVPKNFTFVESAMSRGFLESALNAKRSAGFRSIHYDIIVMVVGIIVGLIILATIIRAIILYRRDRYRLRKDEAKDGISYPLSNPRYHRAGENTPSSRSTLSFTELTKSKKNNKRSEKVSPDETEEEEEEPEEKEKEMETELNT